MEQVVHEDTGKKSLDLVISHFNSGDLATNAREILETVKSQLANYSPENYSEENIKDAKRDKATLNAAADSLNAKRLELERRFMAPFSEFKDIVTETCTLIKKASSQIDFIVKEVEIREKNTKRKELEEFFNSLNFTIVTFEKIFDQAWLNKTTKIKTAQDEIQAKVDKINQDLSVLERIGEPSAQAYYLNTLNLDQALRQAEVVAENRKKLEEAQKKAEFEKAAKVETSPEPKPVPEPILEAPAPVQTTEALVEFTIRFKGTKPQIQALRNYIDSNGISYTKIN